MIPIYKKLTSYLVTEKEFFKNVSFVFSGRFFVALLSLFLTPIIAQLFTPEAYAEFGLYNVIVQNLVIIGTLSLPLAISTVNKSEINKVFNLALSIILVCTAFFTIALFFLRVQLDTLFATNLFSEYWIIILIGFIITAISTSLAAVNIRLQRFKLNTQVGMAEGSSAKAFNLIAGWIGLNSIGLILSDVLSKLIGLFLLLGKIPKEVKAKFLTFRTTKGFLLQYKEYPAYVMPSQWVGTVNNQFIIIAIALLFAKNELGQLVMAIGLLGIPLHLLSNSFQPVITERLSTLRRKTEVKAFFKNMIIVLLLISVTLFTTILLLPPGIFTWVLGNQWIGIKPIINIISIYYIFLLLDQSFENGFIVFNKQKSIFYFSLLELLLQISIILFSHYQDLSLLTAILLISISRSLVSGIRIVYLWQNLKYDPYSPLK